jgi:hypothetical protein
MRFTAPLTSHIMFTTLHKLWSSMPGLSHIYVLGFLGLLVILVYEWFRVFQGELIKELPDIDDGSFQFPFGYQIFFD